MKWFEPFIIIIAVLLVLIPLTVYIAKKKNGTLKCECGHELKQCTGACESCKEKKNSTVKLIYQVSIEGMRCGMCESHINDVIRRNFDILHVNSSRKQNMTIIEVNHLLNIPKLKESIQKEGYSVLSVTLK